MWDENVTVEADNIIIWFLWSNWQLDQIAVNQVFSKVSAVISFYISQGDNIKRFPLQF